MKKMCLTRFMLFCLLTMLPMSILAQSKDEVKEARLLQGKSLTVRIVDGFTAKSKPTHISAVIDADFRDLDSRKVLVRRGTPVLVEVKTQSPRGLGRPGEISLKILSTEAVDGQTIQLSRTVEFEGKNRRGLALGLGIGLPLGTVICFPWGFACLAIKGLDAEVEAGTIIDNVFVQEDYMISLH